MSAEGIVRVGEAVKDCPVCASYAARLMAAAHDPMKHAPPSTKAQVQHEYDAHGSPREYFFKVAGKL